MEPRHRGAQALTRRDVVTWRLRLVAWSVALTALAMVQSPGRVVTDTKLDLTVDPLGFLARSLTAWDDEASFGQLQNQAYGYLFPMGPFHVVLDALGTPDWITQRLWWSLLLVVAFLGMVKLAGRLGVHAPWVRIVVGLLYALSPRILSVLGPASVEVWPMAVAPWVLVALVWATRTGRLRAGAALAALAVVAAGGVNATATFAVVPLGVLWVLVETRGSTRWRLLGWWAAFTLLGTLWWLVPLFVLGAYSPPFLDFIESADNSTFAATLFDALRGTSNWVPYVDANADAGRALVTDPVVIVNGVVVVGAGLAGLALRRVPHRTFLLTGLLTGLVLVTLGHTGAVAGLGSEALADALDGALAPLRNTHKFDLLVRIPLVLGVGHLLVRVTTPAAGRRLSGPAVLRNGPVLLVLAACVGATSPAWTGKIANHSSFEEVPGYWHETAEWLGEGANGRTLLAPASPFGDYVWGKTNDEPIQPLAQSPWVARTLVPLAPGGTVETLDAISWRLASGRGDQGLADFLERAGIGTVVVRHDLKRSADDVIPPDLARATLASTPGMSKVAEFGPLVGGEGTYEGEDGRVSTIDRGWQTVRPAIEVFALDEPVRGTRVEDLDEVVTLVGDPAALLALDSAGVTGGRSVVLAAQEERTPERVLLTDGNRRQEVAFGAVNHQRSASLTESEPYRADRRVHRYAEDDTEDWTTVPRLEGAERIEASSSQADVGALPNIVQDAGVWSAFDGDPRTAWRANPGASEPVAHVELDLGDRRDVGVMTLVLDGPGDDERELTVTTQDGPREVVARGGETVRVAVGRVQTVRVEGRSSFTDPLAIASIDLDGLELSRPLVLPELPDDWPVPETVLLQAGPPVSEGCLEYGASVRCNPDEELVGEDGATLDRVVTLPRAARYVPRLTVVPRAGRELDDLVQQDALLAVTASSQQSTSPRAGALAAVDGDRGTGWVADPDDPNPSLTLRWVGRREVSRVRLTTRDLAASAPTSVRVRGDGDRVVTADVETGGWVRFPTMRTSSLTLTLDTGLPRADIDFDGGITELPVGVSEVDVPGLGGLPVVPDTERRAMPCGTGPTLTVDGRTLRTRVVASDRDLARGREVPVIVCGPRTLTLPAGESRVTVEGSWQLPRTLLLESPGTTRTTDGIEVVSEAVNVNAGWTAEADGRELAPMTLNGWQQAWVLPRGASADQVRTTFAPDAVYRTGLVAGAVALLLLVACAVALVLREEPEPVQRATASRGLGLLVLLTALLVAGPLGVAAAGTGLLLGRFRGAGLDAGVTLAGVGAVVAGTAYVLGPWASANPWGGSAVWPQLLAVVALGACASRTVRVPRWAQRIAGFSTTR